MKLSLRVLREIQQTVTREFPEWNSSDQYEDDEGRTCVRVARWYDVHPQNYSEWLEVRDDGMIRLFDWSNQHSDDNQYTERAHVFTEETVKILNRVAPMATDWDI